MQKGNVMSNFTNIFNYFLNFDISNGDFSQKFKY